MNEFLLLFRMDLLSREKQPSPEQLEQYMKMYHDWVNGIAAQGKFVGGTGLAKEGQVLGYNQVITDGPYAETKESIAGFITIKARDLQEAVSLARACPMLGGEGNTVEVRQVVSHHSKE